VWRATRSRVARTSEPKGACVYNLGVNYKACYSTTYADCHSFAAGKDLTWYGGKTCGDVCPNYQGTLGC